MHALLGGHIDVHLFRAEAAPEHQEEAQRHQGRRSRMPCWEVTLMSICWGLKVHQTFSWPPAFRSTVSTGASALRVLIRSKSSSVGSAEEQQLTISPRPVSLCCSRSRTPSVGTAKSHHWPLAHVMDPICHCEMLCSHAFFRASSLQSFQSSLQVTICTAGLPLELGTLQISLYSSTLVLLEFLRHYQHMTA